jgi:hypothetical protein
MLYRLNLNGQIEIAGRRRKYFSSESTFIPILRPTELTKLVIIKNIVDRSGQMPIN